ncbi:hypothetical protein BDN71DRAFT_1592014 [Pleurotus eryngii]|uniref:Uncharacterized protein n=1 Tax=Pleurotus eryngii TaxID=5323 RepID=A0A9P6D5J0_PLEER|nr:hypothetical protein BDN71DRAFT_1592014 [Pleurotus eryngii]
MNRNSKSPDPLTLNTTIVSSGFATDGFPTTGQVPSLTSTNNFINFCLTYPNLPQTNGSQRSDGSCNSAPIGAIPSIQNIPSVKIVSPKYGDTLQPNTEFEVSLSVNNMQVVTPSLNYFAAPQQLNSQGVIIGSVSFFVIQQFNLTDTQPGRTSVLSITIKNTSPVNSVFLETIPRGLPAGVYRLAAQLRAPNLQTILVPTPEHGSLGDMIYFTVGDGGGTSLAGSLPTPVSGNSIVPAAVNTQDVPQSSLILDPGLVVSGFAESDGPQGVDHFLQTSTNNFINYCLFLGPKTQLPLADGTSAPAGSCNPVPMGVLPAGTKTPSSKFTFPNNGDNLPAQTSFTISLAVLNFQTGSLANPQKSFLAAPQQVNAQGLIIGHAKVVIEVLTGFDQTTPTDPTKFTFFHHISSQAIGGILTADVSKGLPDGYYRLTSILSATNSQPVLLPFPNNMADDAVYVCLFMGDPTKATTMDGGNSSGEGSGSKDGVNSSPILSRSTNKVAIIGATLGGVLGAIILCVLVYTTIRYRRRRRGSVDLDTAIEATLGFLTPFSFFQSIQIPYRRREKPTNPGQPSGPAPTASLPEVQRKPLRVARSSKAASGVGHGEIVPESSTGENPPPYEP